MSHSPLVSRMSKRRVTYPPAVAKAIGGPERAEKEHTTSKMFRVIGEARSSPPNNATWANPILPGSGSSGVRAKPR